MKTRLLAIIGIVVFTFVSIMILSPIEHIECKIIPTYGNCAHFASTELSEIEKNPNECWYQDDDGNITPCRIDSIGPSMVMDLIP